MTHDHERPRNRGGKRRVAFVNSHPIQYFVPLYAHINQSEDIEAIPVYLTDHSIRGDLDPGFKQPVAWDIDLIEGTSPIFVAGARTRKLNPGVTKMWAPDVWQVIRNGDFDAVVVHGHGFGANHIATLAAKSRGIRVFSRGETHLGLPSSKSRERLRKLIMTAYYRLFDGFLTIGTLNRAFYRAMGVPERKLYDFPYTVDNKRMIAASTLSSPDRETYRAEKNIPAGKPAILYASKFMPRKHPDDLIKAGKLLKEAGFDFSLVFAGSGEMDKALREAAAANPELDIVFTGFINQTELPRLFGAADVFVLPSEAEPWGLIINEAMCAGLPIVASREIGSVADLVHEGVNGALFDAGDILGLRDALTRVLTEGGIQKMGAQSRKIISTWNYDRCVEGLRAALDA